MNLRRPFEGTAARAHRRRWEEGPEEAGRTLADFVAALAARQDAMSDGGLRTWARLHWDVQLGPRTRKGWILIYREGDVEIAVP